MIRSFKDRIEKNDINIYIYLYNCSRIITETYINSPIEFKTVINEYDMFNLIHIKKIFDPKKQVLLWTGA